MEKIKRKRLSGTVLLMVVAFMFILIVFCMATLALVSTANKRAYNKFEENQSYYTAASALDTFATGVLSDEVVYARNAGGAGLGALRPYIDNGGTSVYTLSQGRAMELDLYKIQVLTSNPTERKYMGDGKLGSSPIFTFGSDGAPLNELINATDTTTFSDIITYANQLMPLGNDYKHAEYKMLLPGVNTAGKALEAEDNYGIFSDKTINDKGETEYISNIEVEVLERLYDANGVEADALYDYVMALVKGETITDEIADRVAPLLGPNPDDATDTTLPYIAGDSSTYKNLSSSKIKALIKAGTRSRDQMTVRITATASLMGIESKAVRIFKISPPVPEINDQALVNFGYSKNGASIIAIGGSSSLVSNDISYNGNAGAMFSAGGMNFRASGLGGAQIAEDGIIGDGSAPYLAPYLTSLDWISFRNSPNIICQGYNTAYYAVNGFNFVPSVTLGDTNHAAHVITPGKVSMNTMSYVYGNVVAGSIEIRGDNGFHVRKAGTNYGDLYLTVLYEDIDEDPLDGSIGHPATQLQVAGGIYARDIVLSKTAQQLQDYVDAIGGKYAVQLPANVSYAGKIYSSDGIELQVYVDPLFPTRFSFNRMDTGVPVNADMPNTIYNTPTNYPEINYFGDTDGDFIADYEFLDNYKKKFTLPYPLKANSSGTNVGIGNGSLVVDTPRSLYSKYLNPNKVVWGEGFLRDVSGPDPGIPDGFIDAYDGTANFYTPTGYETIGDFNSLGYPYGPLDYPGDGFIDGGDGMILGIDADLDPSTVPIRVEFGYLDKNTFVYQYEEYDQDESMKQPSGGYLVGYAQSDIMQLVATAANMLKDKLSLGDGTTTAIYTANATVDNTAGTLALAKSIKTIAPTTGMITTSEVSTNLNYAGKVTGSGIFAQSNFCEPYQGSKVYLVDTSAGDINLQIPLFNCNGDNGMNIGFVVQGEGRFNILIPPNTSAPAGGAKYKLGGYNGCPFFVLTEDQFLTSGIQTQSGGYYKGTYSPQGAYTTGNALTTSNRSAGAKVTMYVGEGNNLKFEANSIFGGILYAPQSEVQLAEANKEVDIAFNGTTQTGTSGSRVQVMGNVICASYYTTNHNSIVFQPTDLEKDDGSPSFAWIPARYLPG